MAFNASCDCARLSISFIVSVSTSLLVKVGVGKLIEFNILQLYNVNNLSRHRFVRIYFLLKTIAENI